ncbi:MAG: glutamate-5-semialdehyde dehydrogenase [SAR202 cluster bacterium]|jgi:glutamate-5-semialdehyde dehydrogenase|nr:glutamate-5-semialdehyde dehydrogenase [Dehalococcoidia bacterium]MQG53244.1 glutamate-5-semialdehyde dehydrogenase [SAR202 cluster bacterium]|tara:strand:- start:88 stop:1347 length:1260 start_codon:yes stop_codon:yes gene_type:complete
MNSLKEIAKETKAASFELSISSTEDRNKVLDKVSQLLSERIADIVSANQIDYESGKTSGLNDQMLDRLLLTPERIEGMATDVQTIKSLSDPIGEIIEQKTLENGIELKKVRVPLGVLGSIYESRPNVTIDIASLAIKSGNAALLRGGKESVNSNIVLTQILKDALSNAGLPESAVGLITDPDRSIVDEMLGLDEYIDLLVPRGGAGLIKHVYETASMPVVAGGIGVCHAFIDENADPRKVIPIVINSKTQRPTVCNALDTVLVHKNADKLMIQNMISELLDHQVEVRADEQILQHITLDNSLIKAASEDDWGTEFLSLVISIKTVDSLQEALEHIKTHGSGHTEAILSEDKPSQDTFTRTIDAAAVFVNASTRFTDGSQFGLGAEVGISTQKFHARGPLGLKELTSYKWIGIGNGQVRP